MRLREALPEFVEEIVESLTCSGRPELATQVDSLDLASRCGCGDDFCSTFYVTSGRSPLSPDERKERGPHFRDTLDLDAKSGSVLIDLDHLDRIVTVEVLNRPDVEEALKVAIERMRQAP